MELPGTQITAARQKVYPRHVRRKVPTYNTQCRPAAFPGQRRHRTHLVRLRLPTDQLHPVVPSGGALVRRGPGCSSTPRQSPLDGAESVAQAGQVGHLDGDGNLAWIHLLRLLLTHPHTLAQLRLGEVSMECIPAPPASTPVTKCQRISGATGGPSKPRPGRTSLPFPYF